MHQEGRIGSTRGELDAWINTVPQPRTIAMEATIFTGWIYDHLLPHAEKVKVAHPLMLRAIAAAKKKNDRIDASRIADCLRPASLALLQQRKPEIRRSPAPGRTIGLEGNFRRTGRNTSAERVEEPRPIMALGLVAEGPGRG